MRRIFTYSIVFSCLLFTQESFGQTATLLTNTQCNAVNFTGAEGANFNDGSPTNTSGFSGAGWTKVIQGSQEYISIPSATQNSTYNLTTPSYNTASSTLNLKFILGGNAKVASYTIFLQTSTGTTALATISNGSSGLSGEQCLEVSGLSLAPTTAFRFVIAFTTDAGMDGKGSITFDDFFISRVTAAAIPLPVRFSSFIAKTISGGVSLTWNVEAEENLSGYEIERSNDGRSFSKIGFVAASAQRSYSYTDNRPLVSGFYRIKSVDVDGKFMYSTTVSLRGGKSVVLLKAFMSGQNTLTIQHDAAVSGSRISISSADGRLIKSLAPFAGAQQTVTDLSSAKAGLYLVRFDNGIGETETLKVVKQ
jgi:hypothetical protein